MPIHCKDCKWFCNDDDIESCAESIVIKYPDGRNVHGISYISNKIKNKNNDCKDYEEKDNNENVQPRVQLPVS